MPHTYHQASGVWMNPKGAILGTGYSGQPPHTNVIGDEALEGLGPIPAGNWYITAIQEENIKLGPSVLILEPDNDTRARILAMPRDPDSFRIHGERLEPPPGYASDGCIILTRFCRLMIWESLDHALVVMP